MKALPPYSVRTSGIHTAVPSSVSDGACSNCTDRALPWSTRRLSYVSVGIRNQWAGGSARIRRAELAGIRVCLEARRLAVAPVTHRQIGVADEFRRCMAAALGVGQPLPHAVVVAHVAVAVDDIGHRLVDLRAQCCDHGVGEVPAGAGIDEQQRVAKVDPGPRG